MVTRFKSFFRTLGTRLASPFKRLKLGKLKPGKGGAGRAILISLGVVTVISVALALVHLFPFHVYTAKSDSMAPALYRGDLFGVERFSTWFGKPDRYDVVTYRYPLDQKRRLVHRVIGLPNERVRIDKGDIWVKPKGEKWSVLRKPEDVQKHLWKLVTAESADEPLWFADERDGAGWTTDGTRIEASGPGSARFGAPDTSIVDDYRHGHSEARLGKLRVPLGLEENVVSDVRLSGWVRADGGCTEAWIELSEGGRTHRFRIPGPAVLDPDAPGASKAIDAPTIESGGDAVAGQAYRLPEKTEVLFSAVNLDDQLHLFIDDAPIGTLDVDALNARKNEIRVGFEGGGGVWEDLKVERDVFYASPPDESFNVTIPDGEYLLLGDNSQSFADARFWKTLNYEVKTEEGVERFHGNLRPTENPRTRTKNGETWIRFRDATGRNHTFRPDDVKRRSLKPAPFVPGNLIEGRVLFGM